MSDYITFNIKVLKTNSPKAKAAIWGVCAAVLTFPLTALIYIIIAFNLYFSFGGDFGGYGAAPSDPDPAVKEMQLTFLVTAILVNVLIGLLTYRWKYHRVLKLSNRTQKSK